MSVRITRTRRWLLMAAATAALMTAAVACGGDDDDSNSDGNETPDSSSETTATSTTSETATTAEDGEPAELRDVTLMLNWVPNTHHSGIYIAREQGYYEEAGLNVEIIESTDAGAAEIVGNGQVDFGISVQEAVIPARAAGIPIVSIGTILQHSDSSLISLAEDGIEGPADLAGKRYGGFGGPLETELVSTLAQCAGADPSSIEFTDVGNANYLSGMQDDHYDFVWVFEGWDALRYREIDGVELNSIEFDEHYDCIPDWYSPLFITSEDMIANDPDLVRDFMAATSRGYEMADEDPDLAADSLIAGAPEIDEELVRLSAAYYADGRYVDEGQQWGLQEDAIWTDFTAFLEQAGLIDEPIDISAAWTNDFLPGASE